MASTSGKTPKMSVLKLILKKFPKLTFGEALSILNEVRMRNKGTLIGLKMRNFYSLVRTVKEERGMHPVRRCLVKDLSEEDSCRNRTCPICYKIFCQKSTRDFHVQTIHQKTMLKKKETKDCVYKYACQECDKSYAHKVSLERHKKSHQEAGSVITCDKCDKTFTRQDSLWKHRSRVHNLLNMNIGEILQKEDNCCNLCEQKFDNKDELLAHISLKACFSVLTKEEKFQCNDCHKSYKYKSDLNRHVKFSHAASKEMWTCKECGQKFSYKSSFSRHMKDQHID